MLLYVSLDVFKEIKATWRQKEDSIPFMARESWVKGVGFWQTCLYLFDEIIFADFQHCSSPEELSHRDASLMEHGGYEFSQVEPDVRYIYGRVFRSLQGLF